MRHHVRVQAPANVTYQVACNSHLDSPVISALFKMREAIFGRPRNAVEPPPGGLRETMRAIGWEILAEVPGREIVFGAVTQPWKRDVSFRAVPSDEFAAFAEPGYVKIAWTIRVEPINSFACTVATETRVMTTDVEARRLFRRYWAFLSPGMNVIRIAMLGQIKRAAETQARLSAEDAWGVEE